MRSLKASHFKNGSGFTLIETMIVVSVMVIISTMLLSSTKSNQSQIALSTGQAIIVGTLNRAKSMALAKWDPSKSKISACGFGVHFDVIANTLTLFQDLPSCDNTYASNEAVQTINLDPKIALDGAQADIVFSAPYLGTNLGEIRTITLKVKNGTQAQKASVNVTVGGSITSL